MILKQIALVAERLEPAAEELCAVLGLEVCFRDPGVARFGLENVLAPVNGQFLEIVAPVQPGTSAGRYLQRRGGNGGYMVILQCADALAERKRLAALGIRVVEQIDRADYVASHFHPSDTGGVLLSIDHVPGHDYREALGPWPPAGPDWQRAPRTGPVRALLGVELQSDDPPAQAALWARLLSLPLGRGAQGEPELALENARIRFVSARDGRGVGLGGLDVQVTQRQPVLEAAAARGLQRSQRQVDVCGVRVNLLDAP
jgi:Glyoxalase-like domain